MNHSTLSIIWYGLVALVWIVYVTQEMFIVGASIYNRLICKDEGERRQIQIATGMHWDGIEVWLILAVGGLFAAFPTIFALSLKNLYIPFYLLLYVIIARGISIELIYKSDNKDYQKIMSIVWAISSGALIFIIGIYLSTIFYGLPIQDGNITKSFLVIFNLPNILTGVLFVSMSMILGYCFISFITEGDLGKRAHKIAKFFAYIIPWLIPLLFQAYNSNIIPIANGELFTKYAYLYALPLLSIIFGLLTSMFCIKQHTIKTFIFGVMTIVLFLAALFIGRYPYMLPSTLGYEHSISLFDGSAGINTLRIMFYSAIIFVPIVISYQTWKYIKFSKKVKYNDE